MKAKPEDDRPTSEEEMHADLAALKKAVSDRGRLPRYTEAWQQAVEVEERAGERVRRWIGGG